MRLSTPALAAAIALLGAGASFAQQPPPPPGPGPGAQTWRHERPDPAQMAERRAQHLRDALQLRPEQDGALRTYLDSMRPPEGLRDRDRGDREAGRALTTPERLDRMHARMMERQAQFDRRAAATKRFYAQLSPAQQKAFDAMPMRPGFGRGGMGRPGFGHGGPGGFGGHDFGGPGRGGPSAPR